MIAMPVISSTPPTVDRSISLVDRASATWVADALLCGAVVLYLLDRSIELSYLSEISSLRTIADCFRIGALWLISLKALLFTEYSAKQLVLTVLIASVFSASFLMSNSWNLLVTGAFVVGAIGVDYKSICRVGFRSILVCVVVIFFLSIVGAIGSRVTDSSAFAESLFGVSTRNSFGYLHVNYVGMFFISMLFCRLGVNGVCLSRIETAIWLLCAGFLFFIVNTKTAALMIGAVMCIQLLVRYFPRKKLCIFFILASGVFAMLGFFLVVNYSPSNQFASFLNDLLARRLSSAQSFLMRYHITPFGQELELVSTLSAERLGIRAIVLDNAYVNLLLRYGACSLLIVLSLFLVEGIRAIKNKHVGIAFAIAVLFAIGLSETWLFTVPGSFVLMGTFAIWDDASDGNTKMVI